ncbi:MAG: hypothetical protein HYU64_19085 [Armatimonadetes bacterium]|nr:hypothetical protein [Armatimonadota bacterium]
MKLPSDRPWVRRALLLCAGIIFLVIGIRLFLSWWHPSVGKFLVVKEPKYTVPEDIALRIAENYPADDRQAIISRYKNRPLPYRCYTIVMSAREVFRDFECPFEENSKYEVVNEHNIFEALPIPGRIQVRVPDRSDPIWVDKFVGMEFRDRKGNRYFWQTKVWDTGIWCGRCQWYWLEKLK